MSMKQFIIWLEERFVSERDAKWEEKPEGWDEGGEDASQYREAFKPSWENEYQ